LNAVYADESCFIINVLKIDFFLKAFLKAVI